MTWPNFSKKSVSNNDLFMLNDFGLEKYKTIKTNAKDYLQIQEAITSLPAFPKTGGQARPATRFSVREKAGEIIALAANFSPF